MSGQSRKNSNDYLVKLAIMNSVSLLTGGLLYKVLQNPAESPKKTSFVRLGVASIPIIAGVYYSFKLMGNLKHRALFMVRSNPNYMLPDEEAAP